MWRGTLYMPAYIYIWYTGNTLWSCCFMMGHLSVNLFLICIDTLYCFLDVKFDRLSDSHSLSLSISLFHDMSIRCLTLHMMWVHHCSFRFTIQGHCTSISCYGKEQMKQKAKEMNFCYINRTLFWLNFRNFFRLLFFGCLVY